MKTFNMHVKTVITSEHGKILLLKQKRMDKKPRWELPGAPLNEEQSFDETVINNVQKEIGYYVYPGKIIGITSYEERDKKDLYVIMNGTILNGDLVLSRKYEDFMWVDYGRITEYPLAPWLNDYMKHTDEPFNDVAIEIEELDDMQNKRREVIKEDLLSNRNEHNYESHEEGIAESVKGSLGLLKDTIIRTFHPKEAKVNRTKPKNNLFTETEDNNTEEVKNNLNHDNDNIIVQHDVSDKDNNITINNDDIIPENNIITRKVDPKEDMNVNREQNMIKTENPEIKVIHENDKVPFIRKEKESEEKISFNSEGMKRQGWKERLNEMNRTDANNQKKRIPHPKGKRGD